MAIFKKVRLDEEAEIPTASMADIAFLLIIFFMTTTNFARERGLKFVLPEKKDQPQEVKIKSENLLKISINDKGELFLNDEEARWENLEREVKLRLEKNPNLIILIRTHRDAPYDYMIRAFDAVKAAGGKKVSLGIIGGGG
ncbi:MAG: biopolymer transporter ExbD [Candidatus Caldipriscus sp.]|nr:biopolymer transporter ExbD [Candidatus Caldipriscus sp.]